MRIFFIGTVEFSKKALEKLIELNSNVVGVATKRESQFNSDFSSLIPLCKSHNIEYKTINNINSPESVSWISDLKPDVIFCFGWSSLLKKEILNIAPLGVVGYHPAELPMNRGRHPLIWALVLGLKQTASTFFFMEEGADDGDILSQEKVLISISDNAKTLYQKIILIALSQIEFFLKELQNKTFKRIPQDHSKSNLWRKRGKNDGKIDFRMSSLSIYNLVRGLTKPYVGAHIEVKNEDIKVWASEISNQPTYNNFESGKILEVKENKIRVKTGDGSIWITNHEFIELPKINEYI